MSFRLLCASPSAQQYKNFSIIQDIYFHPCLNVLRVTAMFKVKIIKLGNED